MDELDWAWKAALQPAVAQQHWGPCLGQPQPQCAAPKHQLGVPVLPRHCQPWHTPIRAGMNSCRRG